MTRLVAFLRSIAVAILLTTVFAVVAPTRIAMAVVTPELHTLAAGHSHSLVVKDDHTLWAFGTNKQGQLGTSVNFGTDLANSTPTQVLSDIVSVAAGGDSSFALEADGDLLAFGDNTFGKLGDGTTNTSATPHVILTDVVSFASGDFHGAAVKADRTLWTFGADDYGQLGLDGSWDYGPHSTPTQALAGVVAIAAGDNFSLAIKADGSLWGFGSSIDGQLGEQGLPSENPNPVLIMQNVADSLAAARLMDSRVPSSATVDGMFQAIGIRTAGSITELQVSGRGGVDIDAEAVALNVTVTGATAGGYVTVYPCDTTQPNASNLNFSAGDTIPNLVIAKIGTSGKVCIFTSATTHIIADVNGFYANTDSAP